MSGTEEKQPKEKVLGDGCLSGKFKWGNGGLRYSSTIVHDCLNLSSFCEKNSLYERPRKCTIAYDCAQIAESGLKPPFESPHLDFPVPCRHPGVIRADVPDQKTLGRPSKIRKNNQLGVDIHDANQELPRQTKPKKGPKQKVHEFRPFL